MSLYTCKIIYLFEVFFSDYQIKLEDTLLGSRSKINHMKSEFLNRVLIVKGLLFQIVIFKFIGQGVRKSKLT